MALVIHLGNNVADCLARRAAAYAQVSLTDQSKATQLLHLIPQLQRRLLAIMIDVLKHKDATPTADRMRKTADCGSAMRVKLKPLSLEGLVVASQHRIVAVEAGP